MAGYFIECLRLLIHLWEHPHLLDNNIFPTSQIDAFILIKHIVLLHDLPSIAYRFKVMESELFQSSNLPPGNST